MIYKKITSHTGEKISEIVLNSLESHNKKCDNYSGQSHENSANISEIYSSLLEDRDPLSFSIERTVEANLLMGSAMLYNFKTCFELIRSVYNYFIDSEGDRTCWKHFLFCIYDAETIIKNSMV